MVPPILRKIRWNGAGLSVLSVIVHARLLLVKIRYWVSVTYALMKWGLSGPRVTSRWPPRSRPTRGERRRRVTAVVRTAGAGLCDAPGHCALTNRTRARLIRIPLRQQ
jgi:hypothetical protein